MLAQIFVCTVITLVSLGVSATVDSVGKPRAAVTPGGAVAALVYGAALVAMLAYVASQLR